MEFSGTQTLRGAVTVEVGDVCGRWVPRVHTWAPPILGPGLTVRRGSNAGSPGSIGYNPNYGGNARSEERRVGKECGSRRWRSAGKEGQRLITAEPECDANVWVWRLSSC